jgi:hypothetical protein
MWVMLDETTVKELCEKASQERDPAKAAELLASLRALIESENDETRLRIRQILLHYRNHAPIAALTANPRNPLSSFLSNFFGSKQRPSPE